MNKDLEVKMGSTVYGKIRGARLSEGERQVAINAMRNGEAIADAILSVTRAFAHASDVAFHRTHRAVH